MPQLLKYSARLFPLLFLLEVCLWLIAEQIKPLGYLLNATPREFQQWYPRFYWLLYLFFHYHFYVFSVLSLLCLLLEGKFFIRWFIVQPFEWFIENSATFIGLLIAEYFILRYLYNDYSATHTSVQLWLTRLCLVLVFIKMVHTIYSSVEKQKQLTNFLTEPMSPYNLAVFRVFHFLALFTGLIIFQVSFEKEVLNHYENFSAGSRVAIPWAQFYSMHVPVTAEIVRVVSLLFKVALTFSFLGLFTRISTKVYLLCALYLFSIPQLFGKVFNLHHMVWFPVILAFSDCGRVLSLDSLFRKYVLKRKEDFIPSSFYGLPVKFAMITLAIIYFFPGFWKLWGGGFDWIFRYNLIAQMYVIWSQLDGWVPLFRIDHYPLLIIIASLITVGFEIAFPFFLFKQLHRTFLALAALLFHTGTYLFLKIDFFALALNYTVLFDWGRIFGRAENYSKISPFSLFDVLKQQKALVAAFVILTGGNIICGFAKVNSWPFACYPTFDYMIPKEQDFLYYEAYKNGAVILDDKQVQQKVAANLREFHLRSIENKVIDATVRKQNKEAEEYIKKIFAAEEDFSDADSVVVSIVKRGIGPEERESVKQKKQIYIWKNNSNVP